MDGRGGQGRKQGPVAVCSLPPVLGQDAPVSRPLTGSFRVPSSAACLVSHRLQEQEQEQAWSVAGAPLPGHPSFSSLPLGRAFSHRFLSSGHARGSGSRMCH